MRSDRSWTGRQRSRDHEHRLQDSGLRPQGCRRYNQVVPPTLEDARRALKQAGEFAKFYRFEMTGDYLALIALVEALPQNQNGADKSSVWPAQQAYKAFFQNVRLLPLKR